MDCIYFLKLLLKFGIQLQWRTTPTGTPCPLRGHKDENNLLFLFRLRLIRRQLQNLCVSFHDFTSSEWTVVHSDSSPLALVRKRPPDLWTLFVVSKVCDHCATTRGRLDSMLVPQLHCIALQVKRVPRLLPLPHSKREEKSSPTWSNRDHGQR